MLEGLSFLHRCGIIHTDIKPENILLKSPLADPPPPTKTMFDLVQEQISNHPDYLSLKQQCEDMNLSAVERKTLKTKLKRLRMKLKKGISSAGIPTLWGFFNFNIEKEENRNSEVTEEPVFLELQKSEWIYPDDCFYIKMYVMCPLAVIEKAFGPCHGYGDEQSKCVEYDEISLSHCYCLINPLTQSLIVFSHLLTHSSYSHSLIHSLIILSPTHSHSPHTLILSLITLSPLTDPQYSEWTFSFTSSSSSDSDSINRFQLRGHGVDHHTRLHTLRHILMNTSSLSTLLHSLPCRR